MQRALRADHGRVRGMRREDHLVSRAELDVAAGGAEHDPASHAIKHLFVSVLMPAVGIAGAVASPVRAQALGTHPGCDLSSSPGGVPSSRSTPALAPIAEPHHSRECVPPQRPGDGSRGLRRPGEKDYGGHSSRRVI